MKKFKVPRTERVLGYPIKVYDNGGGTLDRYTVLYVHKINRTEYGHFDPPVYSGYVYRGMDHHSGHPQGYGLMGEGASPEGHLGKKIRFIDLPYECQRAVKADIKYFKKYLRKEGIAL